MRRLPFGNVPKERRNVVDFVAVKAQAIHKDQQSQDRDSGGIQFKTLNATIINRIQ
jgi:hypothetical protein